MTVDRAQLQAQHGLEAQSVKLKCDAWVALRANVIQTSFQTQAALIQLAEFLIADTHVVEELESVGLVLAGSLNFDHIEDSVGFLKQGKGLFKLLSLYELKS